MQRKIVEFGNLLRKSGVRVSVAESIDAFDALDHLSLDEREIFKDALRASMVKKSDDINTFDQLFDLYWSGFYDELRSSFDQAAGGLPEGMDMSELMERLQELMAQMDPQDVDLSELAQALLTMDLDQLEQMIRQAAEQAGTSRIENMLQVGFFTRRIMEQMNAEGAMGQLEELAQRLREAGMGDDEVENLLGHLGRIQEALRKSIRNFTERELQKQNLDYMEKFRRESLLDKSFYNLTEEEIRQMREVVTRLAQRIKNILSIRRRRQKKGKLDLHYTLRKNMSHGGVPFEVVYKQKKKDRPKLVILCDV
ncbi:MAG: VWA domain-containing protein [Myxococcales bacterium]|nr:VWA domain-containing protein [Myxococcales bacterium]